MSVEAEALDVRARRSLRIRAQGLAVGLTVGQSIALAITGLVAPLFGKREAFGGAWEETVRQGQDVLSQVMSNWQRWDALWYQHIATFGYAADDGSIAFYPLYPFLSRVLAVPSRDIVLAELFLSAAASIGAFWILWNLSRFEILKIARSQPIGHWLRRRVNYAPAFTVLLLASFPTGFFLVAPYTESLFLFLSLGSFFLMRRGHFWAAGALGLIASLTRAQGILLALPIAVEALREREFLDWIMRRGGRPPSAGILAALLPIVGGLALMAYQSASLATDQVGVQALSPWGFVFMMPWDAVGESLDYVSRKLEKPEAIIEGLNLLALGIGALITVAGLRRLPLSYSVYAASMIGLLFFRTMAFSPLMSASRYVIVVFPCFIVAGIWFAKRPKLAAVWLVLSAGMQLALFQYWVRWGFVA